MIPPQRGTHNTVEMLSDEVVANHLIDSGLNVVGWIHTHPSQTAFLSSVDVHTQYNYQAILNEAVAVVCAPTYGVNKWFRLTEAGMRIVGGCPMDGFHEHASRKRLFEPALNVSYFGRPWEKLQPSPLKETSFPGKLHLGRAGSRLMCVTTLHGSGKRQMPLRR